LTAAVRKAPPKLDRLYNTSTQNYKTDLQDNHKQQVLDHLFASQQIIWPDFTAEEPIVPITEYVRAQGRFNETKEVKIRDALRQIHISGLAAEKSQCRHRHD